MKPWKIILLVIGSLVTLFIIASIALVANLSPEERAIIDAASAEEKRKEATEINYKNEDLADKLQEEVEDAIIAKGGRYAEVKSAIAEQVTIDSFCPAPSYSSEVYIVGFKYEDIDVSPARMHMGQFGIYQGRVFAYDGDAQSLLPSYTAPHLTPFKWDKALFRNWFAQDASAPPVSVTGCE